LKIRVPNFERAQLAKLLVDCAARLGQEAASTY